MHCPNCGSPASTGQQFCRTCGLNLAEFSQLLAEKLPTLKGELRDQKRKLERWALRLWTLAGAIFYISLYWAIIREIIIGKGHVLGGILFLLVITAISVGGLLVLYSSALDKRSKHMHPDAREALGRDAAPELLSSATPELQMSISEHTTNLLESDEDRGPGQQRQVARKPKP